MTARQDILVILGRKPHRRSELHKFLDDRYGEDILDRVLCKLTTEGVVRKNGSYYFLEY